MDNYHGEAATVGNGHGLPPTIVIAGLATVDNDNGDGGREGDPEEGDGTGGDVASGVWVLGSSVSDKGGGGSNARAMSSVSTDVPVEE